MVGAFWYWISTGKGCIGGEFRYWLSWSIGYIDLRFIGAILVLYKTKGKDLDDLENCCFIFWVRGWVASPYPARFESTGRPSHSIQLILFPRDCGNPVNRPSGSSFSVPNTTLISLKIWAHGDFEFSFEIPLRLFNTLCWVQNLLVAIRTESVLLESFGFFQTLSAKSMLAWAGGKWVVDCQFIDVPANWTVDTT